MGEAGWLWGLYATEAAAIFAFNARRAGPTTGGAGAGERGVALFLRHPLAPAVVPLGSLALIRVGRREAPGALGRALALGGVVTVSAAAWTAAGAAIAAGGGAAGLALSAEAVRRRGVGGIAPPRRGDRLRLVIGGGLLAVALPWVFADLGLYVGDFPVLGAAYLSRQRPPRGTGCPAVHIGHHHGMDGALLAWTGLALSRQLPAVSHDRLRGALSSGLAGMTVYGVARASEDAWYEQVVKRGWTARRLPGLVRDGRPVGRRAWAGLLGISWLVHGGLRREVTSSLTPAPSLTPNSRRPVPSGGRAGGG